MRSWCPSHELTSAGVQSSNTAASLPVWPVWLLPALPRSHGAFVSIKVTQTIITPFLSSSPAWPEFVPPLLLYRGVRGSLQLHFLSGSGEKLGPPAGHRRRGLQGQHLGRQQGQLHHGESSSMQNATGFSFLRFLSRFFRPETWADSEEPILYLLL